MGSLLARTFTSTCLSRKPKARVVTHMSHLPSKFGQPYIELMVLYISKLLVYFQIITTSGKNELMCRL
jgi:hypothetical protein